MAFTWSPQGADEAMKSAGRGLEAATVFVQNRLKEILSVPAPRIAFTDAQGGRFYRAGYKMNAMGPFQYAGKVTSGITYKFPKGGIGPPKATRQQYRTADAIPGEPPRKLSGRLRSSIQRELFGEMRLFEGGTLPTKGRVGTNLRTKKGFSYPRWLELQSTHKYMSVVVSKWGKDIEKIVAQTI